MVFLGHSNVNSPSFLGRSSAGPKFQAWSGWISDNWGIVCWSTTMKPINILHSLWVMQQNIYESIISIIFKLLSCPPTQSNNPKTMMIIIIIYNLYNSNNTMNIYDKWTSVGSYFKSSPARVLIHRLHRFQVPPAAPRRKL